MSDNWDEIMFSFARVKGFTAIFFFVSLIVIGVMFFLNIFLAILLENFGMDSGAIKNANNSTALGSEVGGENGSSSGGGGGGVSESGGAPTNNGGFLSKLSNIAKKMLKVQPPTPAAIDASASKTRLMLDSQMLDVSDNIGPRGDIAATPRGELKRAFHLEPTPKTSRNDPNKSELEFEDSYAAYPGASTSRVAETPKGGAEA